MRAIAAAALLTLVAAPAQAGPLWRDAQAGESPAQTMQKLTDSKRNPDPSNIKGSAWCEVHIPKVRVAGRDFEVCFYYENSKLVQVTLDLAGQTAPSAASGAFEALLVDLRRQYGAEDSVDRRSGFVTQNEAKWAKPGRNISLYMMALSGEPTATVKIHYRP